MNWKKNATFLLSIAICCIPLFLTFNRGINYFDEGYILEGARKILGGEVPYRDFHFIYTPGTIYFLALFFRLFGHYIIVERLAMLFMNVVGIIFLGLLIRKLTKNSILVFLSMFLYALWGPAHINFMWPVMCVLPLLFIYFYLVRESRMFLAGIMACVILLCKHNFGVALIISFLCYLVFVRCKKRHILMIYLGFLGVIDLFVLYLLITHSLYPFAADMNTYTIQEVFVRKIFSVPFPTQSIGKFVLYLFPGILSIIMGIGCMRYKKNKPLLIIPLTLLIFYLFGIFPTPDWTHLIPFISVTGALFALIPRIFGVQYRFWSYFLMTFVIGVGLYSITIRNYYRWEAPIVKHTHCFSSGVMKFMCIDGKNYSVISQTVALINAETVKNSSIFSFYSNPIYYFLVQKNNPTPYIDFNVPIEGKEEYKVIKQLQQKNVKILITRFPPGNNQSKIIIKYIEKNYLPVSAIYEFTIWKYKKLKN